MWHKPSSLKWTLDIAIFEETHVDLYNGGIQLLLMN